jgi:hypothetical protein
VSEELNITRPSSVTVTVIGADSAFAAFGSVSIFSSAWLPVGGAADAASSCAYRALIRPGIADSVARSTGGFVTAGASGVFSS